jgi:hypothetical protein
MLKASFVVPRSLTQENKKTNYIPMLTCKQCFKKKYKYGNISPMNDFKIMILGYCIHFFDLVVFIRLQCPIPSAPCNFQSFCISNFACLNCFNKGLVLLKACPCSLRDEPHPHARIPMMLNKISKAKHTNKGRLTCSICCT